MPGLRSAGVDSGTYSVDIVAVEETGEGPRLVYEEALPRSKVVENPGIVVERLRALVEEKGVSSIVMSSGYGVGLKPAAEAEPWEIDVATFIHPGDEARGLRILGLRRAMKLVAESGLPAWFTPGVVQLPTVPLHRKLDRIDLGTSDKLYTAAAALWDMVENRGYSPEEADAIVLEAGYAYTAAIALEAGRIVDGHGGTMSHRGYMGAGLWDSEVAYLAAWLEPRYSKELLFRGGAAELLEKPYPPPSPEEVARAAEEGDEKARLVIEALAEAAAKDVLALTAVVEPRLIYLTGRWARIDAFRSMLVDRLRPLLDALGAEIAEVGKEGRAKEAAFGAALLANGLAGGRYRWLVERLRLPETRGTTPLDWVRLDRLGERAVDFFRRRGGRSIA